MELFLKPQELLRMQTELLIKFSVSENDVPTSQRRISENQATSKILWTTKMYKIEFRLHKIENMIFSYEPRVEKNS